MSNLEGKNILIGISGGIAAYKTPLLIRQLVKRGCNVKVVVTKNALEFVTPIVLQTLSGNKVYSDMFEQYTEVTTEHISLSAWADCMIVAPATANIIAKYANGLADDALSTVLLACQKQIIFCPAMNTAMYFNKAVQRNLEQLRQDGTIIVDSDEGFLACGTSGKGRMANVEEIVKQIEDYFSLKKDFQTKTITITAGPTREKIDSVRFISNNSSGKMGICLAEEFIERGAKVNLILGPSAQPIPQNDSLNLIRVVSADQMYNEAIKYADSSDIIICSAAVADYTVKDIFEGKIKKKNDTLHLDLVPTKDILKELEKRKTSSQILVGFALETDNELENAKKKLESKNLDLIILNSLRDFGAGFEVDTNKITILDRLGKENNFSLKPKREVARDIANTIKTFF